MSWGVLRSNISDVSLTNGSTDTNIRMAINTEQIGSATFHPKFSMRNVEIMTPTLPNVSANTCRNTPKVKRNSYSKSYERDSTNSSNNALNQIMPLNWKDNYLPCMLVLREQDWLCEWPPCEWPCELCEWPCELCEWPPWWEPGYENIRICSYCRYWDFTNLQRIIHRNLPGLIH